MNPTHPGRFFRRLAVGAAMTLASAGAVAQEDQEAIEDDQTELEEIVVVGIRGSLQRAVDAKRNADQIMDAIDAEDIGKLPDTNVAEALSRITGVQINRSLGEGSEIAVRGFSQNRVEINGQTQVGSGNGRGVSFQTIPSEAFSRLEIIKTPAADDTEGALGAIVRLHTRKPLSQPFTTSLNVKNQYADRAGKWAPNVNGLISNRWDLGERGDFGALVNVTYNERRLRQDFLDTRGWAAVNGLGLDLDGDGTPGEPVEEDTVNGTLTITDLQDGAFVPLQTRLRIQEQDRDVLALTTALQWRPNDTLELFFDGTHTQNGQADQQFQITAAFNSALLAANSRVRPGLFQNPAAAVISAEQTVLSALMGQIRGNGRAQRGVNSFISTNSAPADREVTTFQFGAIWEPADSLRIDTKFAYGHGEQENDQFFITNSIAFSEWPFMFFDFGAPTDVPSVVPLRREVGGRGVTEFTDETRINLLDVRNYSLGNALFQLQTESNNDRALHFDVDWDRDWGDIHQLELGVRLAERDGQRNRLRRRDARGNPGDGTLAGLTFAQLEERLPGSTTAQPFDDVLDGASGDFPRDYYLLDPRYVRANQASLLEQFGINRIDDVSWSFMVEESTYAAYLKINLEGTVFGLPYFGNAGVRYVATDQTASGTRQTDNDPMPRPFSQSNQYSNVLPSANIAVSLTENTYLRLAAGAAIARPRLIDVAPQQNIFFFADSGTAGNPDLKPEEVAQFDVSIERYFGESDVLSAAVFHKDFSERIDRGFVDQCFTLDPGLIDDAPGDDGCAPGEDLITLSTPLNTGEAKVTGMEFGYQHAFTSLPSPFDGLGVIANYTLVDSDSETISRTGARLPAEDLSENSYNLIGYYEKYGISARIAYGWREEFFDGLEQSNAAGFSEDYGQLDLALSYQANNAFTITFEALNILNEPERRFQEIRERFLAYRVNDTRYLLGFRWRTSRR